MIHPDSFMACFGVKGQVGEVVTPLFGYPLSVGDTHADAPDVALFHDCLVFLGQLIGREIHSLAVGQTLPAQSITTQVGDRDHFVYRPCMNV